MLTQKEHIWRGNRVSTTMTIEERFAPIFRKTFEVHKPVSCAKAYVC